MGTTRLRNWMWSEALEMLGRVEQLHHQSFEPARALRGVPCWEPPVDVLETEREVLVLIALPGVDLGQVHAAIEDGKLQIVGQRVLPPELGTAIIHRLELPQGRFERHLALPPGRYDGVRKLEINGCLLLALRKASGIGVR